MKENKFNSDFSASIETFFNILYEKIREGEISFKEAKQFFKSSKTTGGGIYMDIRSMLLRGLCSDAEAQYGRSAVRDEIHDMIYAGLADSALKAGKALGYRDLEVLAQRVIDCSGSY